MTPENRADQMVRIIEEKHVDPDFNIWLRDMILVNLREAIGDCKHPGCCCVCGHKGKCPEDGPSLTEGKPLDDWTRVLREDAENP